MDEDESTRISYSTISIGHAVVPVPGLGNPNLGSRDYSFYFISNWSNSWLSGGSFAHSTYGPLIVYNSRLTEDLSFSTVYMQRPALFTTFDFVMSITQAI